MQHAKANRVQELVEAAFQSRKAAAQTLGLRGIGEHSQRRQVDYDVCAGRVQTGARALDDVLLIRAHASCTRRTRVECCTRSSSSASTGLIFWKLPEADVCQ